MKEKNLERNQLPRRSFLTNCVKIAAGASLLGLNTKAFGIVTDSYEDYSYCIYKCPSPCSADAACTGCRTTTTGGALTCTTRVCVTTTKKLPSCAHCSDLATCNKDLWVNYPGQRQYALQKQNEWKLLSGADANDKIQNRFRVYPTVTGDGITIGNNRQTTVDYRLCDIAGKTAKEGSFDSNDYYLDLLGLASGSYILSLSKGNELLHISKFIKK